jgi:hypothetical protein
VIQHPLQIADYCWLDIDGSQLHTKMLGDSAGEW